MQLASYLLNRIFRLPKSVMLADLKACLFFIDSLRDTRGIRRISIGGCFGGWAGREESGAGIRNWV